MKHAWIQKLGLAMCFPMTSLLATASMVWAVDSSPPSAEHERRAALSQSRTAVLERENRRTELVARLSPTVVCVFDEKQRGGGSGVLIDADGTGLTNYHVVSSFMGTRKGWGGLNDGKLYELEVLGIDPTGDVAMFRLNRDEPFQFSELGDSSSVHVGDTAIAMGNPFSLSEDYTPTVTMGIVTGLHRYQKGTGDTLVYSDCIQVDASINPGNSGGPLFDEGGRVIGINGRISVSARGRLNVGFGYAISVDQIKRFIPSLRAGLQAKHGTLQATVEDQEGKGVVFNQVLRDATAARAGVRVGDRLLALDGISLLSRNHLASLIGTYPADWPVRLRVESGGVEREMVLRLEPITPKKTAAFQPNRGVSLRRIQQLLHQFRTAALGFSSQLPAKAADASNSGESDTGPAGPSWPRTWEWSVTREYMPGPDGVLKEPERFLVSQVGDQPAVMRQRYDDGSFSRIIEYTDRSASWRKAEAPQALGAATEGTSSEPEQFAVPHDAKLVLGALYVFQRLMGSEPTVNDLARVNHLGGFAFWAKENEGMEKSEFVEPVLTELIEWPLGDHATARFAFDLQSARVVRVIVVDSPSAQEAVLDLNDYRDQGGIVWPARVEVKAGGAHYRDSLSDFRIRNEEN